MTTIRKYILTIFIISVLITNASATLIFDDTFRGTSLDKSKWRVYGNEPQPNGDSSFDPDNIIVNNGLHIRINRFDGNPGYNFGKNYVGGGLENSGYHDIVHGRWEVRARFPSGQGLVGYIGLFTSHQWPPEIDLAETSGSKPNQVEFTQHWDPDNKMELSIYKGDITQFHTYIVDVENNQLKWYVDGELIATQYQHFNDVPWMIAAGAWAGNCDGNWPGCPTNSPLPAYVDIDYVRIYDSIPTDIWHGWSLTSGMTNADPSMTTFNNRLYSIVRGMDGAIFVKSMGTDNIWTDWTPIGGVALTDTGPSIITTTFNGKLYAMVVGTDNNLYINSMDTNGVWSGWSSTPGMSNANPSITAFNNRLYSIVRGMDGTIFVKSMGTDNIWTDWTSIGGITFTGTGPSITTFNGKLYTIVIGTDNNLYINSMDTNGVWSGWSSTPGMSSADPSITTFNDNLYVTVKGTDGGIYTKSMNTNNVWSGWSTIPDSGSIIGLSTTTFNGRFYVMSARSDNRIYINYLN